MFAGYSLETVDFLWGIRLNNNREWFLAHKKEYMTYLYEPTKALGAQLFEPFLDKPGNLLKVSRIYRDARLHHPLPYKESLWVCIRQDTQWWAENVCLFFEINPEGIFYGLTLWHPRVSTLEDFRKRISEQPAEFLDLIRKTEKAAGQPVTADVYKRPKAAPCPELEPYFAWKGNICCTRQEPFSPETFSPELARKVGDFLTALTPLYEYLTQFHAG